MQALEAWQALVHPHQQAGGVELALASPRHHEGHGDFPQQRIGTSRDRHLGHARLAPEQFLEFLRGQPPRATFDHVAAPADDRQIPPGIPPGQVSGVQPAVAQDLGSQPRVPPISVHQVGAPGHNLAHLARRGFGTRLVHQLQFDAGESCADGTGMAVKFPGGQHRQPGRPLGLTIHHVQRHSGEGGPQSAEQVGGQGPPRAGHIPQVGIAPALEPPPRQQQREGRGDRAEASDPLGNQAVEVAVPEDHVVGEHQSRTGRHVRQQHRVPVRVKEGETRQDTVGRREPQAADDGLGIREQRPMRQRHPLGPPGGSRGVDELRQVPSADCGELASRSRGGRFRGGRVGKGGRRVTLQVEPPVHPRGHGLALVSDRHQPSRADLAGGPGGVQRRVQATPGSGRGHDHAGGAVLDQAGRLGWQRLGMQPDRDSAGQ